MIKTREEITEKYLFLALNELAKHRGAIKKGRTLETLWRKEILYHDTLRARAENKQNAVPKINLRQKQ